MHTHTRTHIHPQAPFATFCFVPSKQELETQLHTQHLPPPSPPPPPLTYTKGKGCLGMSTNDSDRQPTGRVDDMYVGILGGDAQETRAALSSPCHAVNGHVTGLKAACLLKCLKPQQHQQDEQGKSMNSASVSWPTKDNKNPFINAQFLLLTLMPKKRRKKSLPDLASETTAALTG